MNPAPSSSSSDSVKQQFYLRLGLWLLGYGLVIVACGAHNAWPGDLWVSLCFLPIDLWVSSKLYQINRLGFDTNDHPSEWGVLITYLVFAIGIASGLLLLISVGWVSIGVAFLRPARMTAPWSEWLKIPVLFLFNLPIFWDLAGSRMGWLQYFSSSVDPFAHFEAAANLARFQILIRVGILLLACGLRGPGFWISLPIIPLLLLASAQLVGNFPSTWLAGSPLREGFSWVFVPGVLTGYVLIARQWTKQNPWPPVISEAIANWIETRSFAPWLATLVILLQQSSLIEGWRAGSLPTFDLAAASLLLLILIGLRLRSGPRMIYSRSRILLAAALLVLLAAEWTDLNPLRHVALGLLVICLISWRRAWPWPVTFAALLAWVSTLPAPAVVFVRWGMNGDSAIALRSLLFIAGMLALIALSLRFSVRPTSQAHNDYGWQPVKRFAFILLALLFVFQTVSAFWPEPNPESAQSYDSVGTGPLVKVQNPIVLDGMSQVQQWRSAQASEDMELFIAKPWNAPVELNAPELILKSWGWKIIGRRLIPHPRGEAVELLLERNSQRASALFWFEHDGHAFTNYLRGRRILWSGWNLERRDLRLVLLHSANSYQPEKLISFAESRGWFQRGRPSS